MENIIILLLIIILAETTYLSVTNKSSKSKNKNKAIFVDTSALMDGRLVGLARTGFLQGRLQVPTSVVAELQLLADTADAEKRARARSGLDAIVELQNLTTVDLSVVKDTLEVGEGVDESLVKLALKNKGASILTLDYNLNKVAQVNSVKVLNINDLALELRLAHLPGDIIEVALKQKGQDALQATGHLEDGTMVVVEDASKMIGSTIKATVVRSLQTAAGRMIFAKPVVPVANERRTKGKRPNDKTAKQPSKNAGGRSQQSRAISSGNQKPRASLRKTHEDNLVELINNQN